MQKTFTHDDIEINIYSEEDFAGMRKAGKLAGQLLNFIEPHVQPGISTVALDDLCHQFVIDNGARPAPLGYHGYPKSTCISVNHVVCHGVPSETKILKSGDIVNIDVVVEIDGWHGDTSRTFLVGKVSTKAQKLVDITQRAMMLGIDNVKPGVTLGDIGHMIQVYAESHGYSIVREFCGHGIGRSMHESPNVLHYGVPGTGVTLREGMIFTIEPMLNAGKPYVKILNDGWTAVTKDKSLSAQFEHTIGVTRDGREIFTLAD